MKEKILAKINGIRGIEGVARDHDRITATSRIFRTVYTKGDVPVDYENEDIVVW